MEGIFQGISIPPLWTHGAAFVAGFVLGRKLCVWLKGVVAFLKSVAQE